MNEELLKKIQFEKFTLLLAETLESGYGELNYKIVIRDGRIDYVALSKANTYKVENVTI